MEQWAGRNGILLLLRLDKSMLSAGVGQQSAWGQSDRGERFSCGV
jgi:hypothetical protein